MQWTESTLTVGAAAGGNGHKAIAALIADGSIHGLPKASCQNTRQSPLAVMLERQQALCQFVPVGSRSHHAQPRSAVDSNKGRRLQLCPEGLTTQLAHTLGAACAKDSIFRTATDAFDRNHNRPKVFQRAFQGRNQPGNPTVVPSAATRPPRVGRQQVRVRCGTASSAGRPTAG
ncbi:hypothetical protein StoSoilB3_27090 [Arthrobacter sp. StoSoilB3]|nr:hypothetical protein StoSoilB3_27090 [Arthrobacter sp. StoSoilB3]